MSYQPPFAITKTIQNRVAEITEQLGGLANLQGMEQSDSDLQLRRINRIRTIQGSLAIEGNTLSEDQITAIFEGKPVIAPPREIQEARNAIEAYEQFENWQSGNRKDLLNAHQTMMMGLIDDAGQYRHRGVGVMKGDQVVHMAPQAGRVNELMIDLLNWLKVSDAHPLIISSVFHYEFEFIHPFSDGNGRLGRLWQTLTLSEWQAIFKYLPVESMVYANQRDYYSAINQSTIDGDSAPFIEFMLDRILAACKSTSSGGSIPTSAQVTPHVTPQVEQLLCVMQNDTSRKNLQNALGLKDRKSFRQRYLLPAIKQGLVEMTLPNKPQSSLQKYRLTRTGMDYRANNAQIKRK